MTLLFYMAAVVAVIMATVAGHRDKHAEATMWLCYAILFKLSIMTA